MEENETTKKQKIENQFNPILDYINDVYYFDVFKKYILPFKNDPSSISFDIETQNALNKRTEKSYSDINSYTGNSLLHEAVLKYMRVDEEKEKEILKKYIIH